jgi:ABC-type transport system substrate-binding protein
MRTVVAAGVVATIASVGVVALTSSPASAASTCRSAYTQGGWRAQPCAAANSSFYSWAYGRLSGYPSNCRSWKIIAIEEGGIPRSSTSLHPCSTIDLSTASFYSEYRIQSRLVAYDAAGNIVLDLASDFV